MVQTEDFSIGTVSRLTGISQHTLRVWERRYSAVRSRRSEGGRRLYSSDDIERLSLLKALVDRGDRIGGIAAEDIVTLRTRLGELEDHSETRSQLAPAVVDLAVCGETLADRLRSSTPAGTRVVVAEADAERFRAAATLASVDVLVLEFNSIDQDTPERVASFRQAARADRVLVVYAFGRSDDRNRLVASGVQVLRAPADLHAIAGLIGVKPGSTGTVEQEVAAEPAPGSDLSAPPHALSTRALQKLAETSSTVECECPQHLVDLVRSLSAFEVYSSQCRNRNDQDAALHAYLHVTTARARALMEQALIHTAETEGIAY